MRRILFCATLFLLLTTESMADEIYAMNPPCRVWDTRHPGGGGVVFRGTPRSFLVRAVPELPGGSQGGDVGCGVPTTATGVIANVGVVSPSGWGWATLYTYGNWGIPYVTVVSVNQGDTFAVTGSTTVWLAPWGTREYDLSLHYYAMDGHAVVDLVGWLEP